VRFLVFSIALFAMPTFAAEHWIEYQSGPLHVFSDAGDKLARARLTEMEQLRYLLGTMMGKIGLGPGGTAKSQFEPIWPVDLILFANATQYGPHALQKPFVDGGSATLGAWSADTPLPRDMLRALTRLLVDDNAGQMPETFETALCDLFSTIDVKGPKVLLGAPLPAGELPPDRLRAWAKMQLIVTNPDYAGKGRVYLNNLQQGGDEGLASRNAFGVTPAQLDATVDTYLRTGKFAAAPAVGEALSPHDFIEKPMPAAAMDGLLAELAAKGQNFPPDSPRGLLAQNTRESLALAVQANPRWAEPHFQLADINQSDPDVQIRELKIAVSLEPRNLRYLQALATAQYQSNLFADSDKTWATAEKNSPTDAERDKIRQVRADMVEKRTDFEELIKKRTTQEEADHLQKIKDAAAAEVHAAERAANQRLGERKLNQAPVPWWDGSDPSGEKISGTLSQVDCLNGPIRLTIKIDGGGTIKLLIRDPKQVSIHGSENGFACGVQRKPPKIKAVYNVKADAKLDTVGEVLAVDLP
jgi:hypothetical protein